ncbi:hypothetical protein Mapa_011628 [Marchantia paleacea]|nr:hypothetical protein Mapa_011628 [Marchantia paleacea]
MDVCRNQPAKPMKDHPDGTDREGMEWNGLGCHVMSLWFLIFGGSTSSELWN